jgi:hypothetical protein
MTLIQIGSECKVLLVKVYSLLIHYILTDDLPRSHSSTSQYITMLILNVDGASRT